MDDTLIRRETPTEYFKEMVETALEHQHLEAGELTSFYVVNLLARFLQMERGGSGGTRSDDEPLAVTITRAIEGGGVEQRAMLRRVGDLSLFISGFFSDSLNRKVVDVDYYVALGGYAYGSLSRSEHVRFSPVFAELAANFMAFVDILSEVSERSALTTNADLLRLYEKWLRTGSRRDGQLLVERGIFPPPPKATRLVQ